MQRSNNDLISLEQDIHNMAKIRKSDLPDFSPNNKTISFISDMSGVPQVWLTNLDGNQPKLLTTFDDPVVRAEWDAFGEKLAVSVPPGGGMNTQIYLVKRDGTVIKRITQGGKENNWFGKWFPNDSKLLFTSNEGSNQTAVYLYDSEIDKLTLITQFQGVSHIEDIQTNGKSALIWNSTYRGDNNIFLLNLTTREKVLLTPHENSAAFNYASFISPSNIVLSSNLDRDMTALGLVELNNNKPSKIKIIAAKEDIELQEFVVAPDKSHAVLVWNKAGLNQISIVYLGDFREQEIPGLPVETVYWLSFSKNGNYLAMTGAGSVSPRDIWVLNLKTKNYEQITFSPHPGVDLSQLIKPSLVSFKSHDGLTIYGWLYLPKNFRQPNAVVLNFHGGPEDMELPTFSRTYQALLSQDIAVFAPNVRGSWGFGKQFLDLDNGQLRFNAIKDIKASVDYLVNEGIADKSKIGIMGASYGGYMTMAGLTHFPDSFAAGVNLFGIVNFETFFEHTEEWMASISKVEYGDPISEKDLLKSLSPIHKIQQVQAPTLVLHGDNDTNVPLIEAEQLVQKLQDNNIPVKLIRFADEGHGFRKTENVVYATVEIVKWFSHYLTGDSSK